MQYNLWKIASIFSKVQLNGVCGSEDGSISTCNQDFCGVYYLHLERDNLKKLFKYMKDYRKECIVSPLAKLLEATLELLVPLVVASLIDKGIAAGSTGYIIRMCLLMAALAAVGLSATLMAQYFAAKAATGFVGRLRHALYAHLQTLSYADLDRLGTSTLLTRMTSDMNQVQNGVNLALRLLLRSPFIVFGAMVMAFTIDVSAALVFVVVIPILFAVVFAIMLCCIPLYRKVQQRLDHVMELTRENLTGVRVIRAFGVEEMERKGFADSNRALSKMQQFVGKISALMNPLTFVIINLAIVWLIHRGAIQVDAGRLTQGQVVALYNYMSQILVELIKMANLILTMTKAIACGKRISAVLDIAPGMSFPEQAPQSVETDNCVEFRQVTFSYHPGADPALADFDLCVKRGQTVGIIGGTGSGKTTLVNLIGRFYDVTDGAVLVDGVNVRDYPKQALRQKIGIVPQKGVLFHGTIRDNLRWGNPDASDCDLLDAIAIAQASEVVAGKAGGLDGVVGQGGRNFSGGQRQRLTIARALVRKPEILILDDSASALDLATDAALRNSLRTLSYCPTVFIVSQRTASLLHADKIVVLDDGKVAGIGTHEELLQSCTVYREIYDSQFHKGGQSA